MKAEKSTSYVVDASLILGFLLPDEYDIMAFAYVKEFINGDSKFIAPSLLPYEVINGLKNALRRKRISLPQAIKLIDDFLELIIPLQMVDLTRVLELAEGKDLTVYDASYLYLAKKLKVPLLTIDSKMKELSLD